MFERFTDQARTAVRRAQHEARDLGRGHVGTEHLLLALLEEDAGVAYTMLRTTGLDQPTVRAEIDRLVGPAPLGEDDAAALRTIGIDLDAVRARIEENFGPDALGPEGNGGRARFSPRSRKVLELALREAIRLHKARIGTGGIGTEHILLGLLREGDGVAAKILVDAGADLAELHAATVALLRRAA